MLTPDDLHNVVFAKTWRRNSGYDATEVDELLERVEATLRGKQSVSAREVLTTRFSPGRPGRGYKKEQVAKFLDQIALTLMKREVRAAELRGRKKPAALPEARTERTPLPAEGTVVRRRPAAVEARPNPGPPPPAGNLKPPGSEVLASPAPNQPALDKAEVDAFMDRVEATLRGADTLTAQEVINARFNPPRQGMPGYQESSVFAFLVMVSTIIKQMSPRDRFVPPQRMSIGRAFPRPPEGSTPQLTPDAIEGVTLTSATVSERGYSPAEVDAFLRRVAATLRGGDTVTSKDVRNVALGLQREPGTGYDRAEVESLLDLIADHFDTNGAPHQPHTTR